MIILYLILSLAICLCFFGIVAAFDKMRLMSIEIEHVKNRMVIMEARQQLLTTGLDMLFAAKYEEPIHEVRH